MNKVSKNIKKILRERNKSVRWLTLEADLSTNYLHDLLEGRKKDISLLKAKKIADVLNVSLDELVK